MVLHSSISIFEGDTHSETVSGGVRNGKKEGNSYIRDFLFLAAVFQAGMKKQVHLCTYFTWPSRTKTIISIARTGT